MAYRLRTIDPSTTVSDRLTMDLFAQHLPHDQILAALTTARQPQQRVRKLSHAVIVWLVIAMTIWSHLSIEHVFQKLARRPLPLARRPPCLANPQRLLPTQLPARRASLCHPLSPALSPLGHADDHRRLSLRLSSDGH